MALQKVPMTIRTITKAAVSLPYLLMALMGSASMPLLVCHHHSGGLRGIPLAQRATRAARSIKPACKPIGSQSEGRRWRSQENQRPADDPRHRVHRKFPWWLSPQQRRSKPRLSLGIYQRLIEWPSTSRTPDATSPRPLPDTGSLRERCLETKLLRCLATQPMEESSRCRAESLERAWLTNLIKKTVGEPLATGHGSHPACKLFTLSNGKNSVWSCERRQNE
ncbi:uncharacterized protein LOC143343551 [Colletes latitarsis]|uniref:uncharacterized protein LOC143343551 n=1 Tax=Colletes latitarsis TaxID=2605962 RepID=UPI00403572D8